MMIIIYIFAKNPSAFPHHKAKSKNIIRKSPPLPRLFTSKIYSTFLKRSTLQLCHINKLINASGSLATIAVLIICLYNLY